MKIYPFCDPYVWENPKVLLYTGLMVKNHKHGECASEYMNNLILVYVIALTLGIIGTVAFDQWMILLGFVAAATLYSLPTMWWLLNMKSMREGFADAAPAEVYDVIGEAAPPNLTLPTARNPFMNVLIDEIKYNPTRPMAASIMDPSVKVGLDDFFRTEFYSDPTDVFGKTQSQRQFITMPSTSIPNDQESYQNWLYRIPGKTCKEGGREACLPGTDGGPIPWLNSNPS
jgi:hypothetical protein